MMNINKTSLSAYRGTAECFKCKYFSRNLSYCGKFSKKLVDFGGSFSCMGFKQGKFLERLRHNIMNKIAYLIYKLGW